MPNNYYAEKGAASQDAYDAYYETTGNTSAYTAQAHAAATNMANRGNPEQFTSTKKALEDAGIVDEYGIAKDNKMMYLVGAGIVGYLLFS